uniref:Uncharacterized protein n=1 Tax=Cucumis melo TaxID=3656 RepID=A0A9I9E509_CUCME
MKTHGEETHIVADEFLIFFFSFLLPPFISSLVHSPTNYLDKFRKKYIDGFVKYIVGYVMKHFGSLQCEIKAKGDFMAMGGSFKKKENENEWLDFKHHLENAFMGFGCSVRFLVFRGYLEMKNGDKFNQISNAKYECLFFDLDDTLYLFNYGLAKEITNKIQVFAILEKILARKTWRTFCAAKIQMLKNRRYKVTIGFLFTMSKLLQARWIKQNVVD